MTVTNDDFFEKLTEKFHNGGIVIGEDSNEDDTAPKSKAESQSDN